MPTIARLRRRARRRRGIEAALIAARSNRAAVAGSRPADNISAPGRRAGALPLVTRMAQLRRSRQCRLSRLQRRRAKQAGRASTAGSSIAQSRATMAEQQRRARSEAQFGRYAWGYLLDVKARAN